MRALLSSVVVSAALAASASGCAFGAGDDADDAAEDVEDVSAELTSRCAEGGGGLCVGTSNLYFGGRFDPGWRYPVVDGRRDKTRACKGGRCKPAAEAETFGTLRAFASYVERANLSIVSIQEAPPAAELPELHAALGPAWGVACRGHLIYRRARIIVTGEARPTASDTPAQLSPICGVYATVRAGGKRLFFVGGGLLTDPDGTRSPGGYLANWAKRESRGRPIVIALDMNGTAPGDPGAAMNTNRFGAMRRAGYVEAGHRDTVSGSVNRTLDYVWAHRAAHSGERGSESGGSDHVWIWSKVVL